MIDGILTERAHAALALAHQEATRFDQATVGTEHLLLGLVGQRGGALAGLLSDLGIEAAQVRQNVAAIYGRDAGEVGDTINLTPCARHAIQLAEEEARRNDGDSVDAEHLLLGLIASGGGYAVTVLEDLGIDVAQLQERIAGTLG